ncbi:hypothetical protein [Paracoccus sp. (in: a-proteobacteria)]|uniref:hypothetical protein n=1 Tax=Paracoccus sp. TaxID=267 RepID=UPI003340AD14
MFTETTKFQDGKLFLQKTQDVSADIERARRLTETHRSGGDMRLAGTIPMVVAQAWSQECGAGIGTAEFAEYVKAKLMDGEFAKFRVKGF